MDVNKKVDGSRGVYKWKWMEGNRGGVGNEREEGYEVLMVIGRS